MILSISNSQIEFVQIQSDRASKTAQQIITILTSDKAQDIYRGILTAIALIAVVIGVGLYRAAKQWIFPVSLCVATYTQDKARQGARWGRQQLAQWRSAVMRRMAIEWANAVSLVVFAWQGIAV
jgi:hypothetical protein